MSQQGSRYINGNMAHWQGHRHRIVDAVGLGVTKYVQDFTHWPIHASSLDPVGWTTTVVEAGSGVTTFLSDDVEGGGGIITPAAGDNDGGNYQLNGESFKFSTNSVIYFGAWITLADADQSDILVGLCITDTTLLGSMTDGVYFESLDASASISFVKEKNSNETQEDTLGTLVDDAETIVEFYYDGPRDRLYPYIDGALVGTGQASLANMPDDEELRLSIHYLTGEAVANTCKISRLVAIQMRGV